MTEGTTNKWSIEEREKMLTIGTLDQRKEAFKDDEELMRETTKFVTEVIETATTEASKRKADSERTGTLNEELFAWTPYRHRYTRP
ncbi:uncharacterized protein LOC143174146 isoform X2 [Nomia melanderi]|uniref:uncharacterized protein LOC143174146 isoform X2 n=1 Tax=Nomia melanderi TaxID=2448451 RepID=UPI003FCCA2C5